MVRNRYDVRSLRWVTHTGAPCPREVKKDLMDWWGPVVYEGYGGTEVGTVMLATPQDWLEHPGCVGDAHAWHAAWPSMTRCEGNRLPEGEIGEIFARVPAYPDFTYLNHEEKRKSVSDGLISLGDVGYMKEGRLYLCDRRSDMVIFGGTNIYPAEQRWC